MKFQKLIALILTIFCTIGALIVSASATTAIETQEPTTEIVEVVEQPQKQQKKKKKKKNNKCKCTCKCCRQKRKRNKKKRQQRKQKKAENAVQVEQTAIDTVVTEKVSE